MSFTDQQPQIATKQNCAMNWSGGKHGKYFRCYLCGHRFVPGDRWRFVFINLGNLLLCASRDGTTEEISEKYRKHAEEWNQVKEKFWRDLKNAENVAIQEADNERVREFRRD